MPYRPTQRRTVRAETTIVYAGESVKVWYRPAVFTPRFLADATAEGETNERLAQMVSQLIASWEVLDENDEQVSPTAENIMEYELAFLRAVIDGVALAMQPGESNVVNYAAG